MSQDESKRPEEELSSSPAADDTVESAAAQAGEPATPAAEPEEDRFSAFDTPVRPDEKAPKKRRLNPRIRTLIIALVAVVVLVAVLLLIPLLPEEQGSSGVVDSTVSEPATITVLDKTTKDTKDIEVTNLVIRNESGEYTVLYNEKQSAYQLKSYEDLALEEVNVTTLTECASLINAMDQIDTVGALADYGLDKPAVTATFTYHDKSTATLLVGDITPAKDGYYVAMQGDNRVYVCSSDSVASFLMSAAEYVETTLITAPTTREDDKNGTAVLKELTLTGTAHPQTLTLIRSSAVEDAELSYFNYVITKPYLRGTVDSVSTALTGFTSLTASQATVLHPTDKQLKELGFKNPYTVAKVTLAVESTPTTSESSSNSSDQAEIIYYGNTTYTITVGSVTKDGDYLVMVDGIDAIFLVSNTALSAIVERQYENTVSSLLFLKDITQLGRISVQIGDKTYNFKMTHNEKEEDSDKKLTITMDGKTYSTPEYRSLYQLMMGLERYGKADIKPSGAPELVITMYETNGSEYLSTSFYSQSGSLYTVRTSEGELFTTRSSFVTHFVKQVDNYLNGKEVLER